MTSLGSFTTMRIAILALEDLFDTGLIVTLDTFKLANKFASMQRNGAPRFDVSVVGVRKKVKTGQGLSIPVKIISQGPKPDWAIVPALSAGSPQQLIPALARRDVIDAKRQLQKWYSKGVNIAASCIGSFI